MAAQNIDNPARSQGYILYRSWGAGLRQMPDEDLGSLLRAITMHADGLEVNMDDLRPAAQLGYAIIASTMDQDAARYERVCEARREAGKRAHDGKKGGKAKKDAPAPAETDVAPSPAPKKPAPARPGETPLERHLRVDLRMTDEERAQWQRWYSAYPRHTAVRAGARAWRDAVRSGVPVETLQRGAEAYATACRGQNPQYVAQPHNWINAGRYDDAPERPGTPQPRRAAKAVASACSGLDVFLGGDLQAEPDEPVAIDMEASHDA